MSRIWDKFMTAGDQDHLGQTNRKSVGVGKRPAVLNIDLYRAVFGDENLPMGEGLKLWPSYCGPAAWTAVPHIQALHAAARARKIPVFHITGLAEEESGIPGWFEAIHGGARRPKGGSEAEVARYLRRYDILDEVGPRGDEVVLRKTAPSAFWGTPLMAQLNHLGIDTLFIAGESTSGCVRATVVDAASYRFKVQVVETCVFDRHEACHAINLFDMHQKYADVVSIEDAVDSLRSFD